MKQCILIRRDLRLSPGKAAAQASHASLEAYRKADKVAACKWEQEGQKKIILRVSGEKELISIFNMAKKENLPCALVRDAGHTQVPTGTLTALAIGPAEDDILDKLTGHLRLY